MNEIDLRPATVDDYTFLYRLHKATMRIYVEQIWGWDEVWQERHFHQHFSPISSHIVLFQRESIGVVSIEERETEFALVRIEILPEYQRKGVGTYVINLTLDEAAKTRKLVSLQVLKINVSARKLYEQLGFLITGETQTHYLMRVIPKTSDKRV